MKKRINLILLYALIIFNFLQFGCVTQKVIETSKMGIGVNSAQWETQAVIKNLSENKNSKVDIDIFAIKNDRARFEISAILGFQVASLVTAPKSVTYINYAEKKYFFSNNSSKNIETALNIPINLSNLSFIAFEQPISGPGWKCYEEPNGILSKCENISKALSVSWMERRQGTKKVVLTAPQFEMQWFFKSPKTNVQFKSDIFSLKQPNGFKAIQIN